MKNITFAVAVVAVMALAADTTAQGAGGGLSARERAYARKAAKFGGMIQRPNAHPGKFAFVNAQGRVAASNLTETVGFLKKMLHANIVLEDGKAVTAATAGSARKDAKADAAVFLVEDKTMPDMMLVSPEGRWAIVNVAALAADGAASQYAVARLHKEMVRAFAYLAGGCGSAVAGHLLAHTTRPDQLDAYSEARPPMDVLAKVSRRLPQLGITPQRMATYQQACKEGWAPAPTNDVQRTIWNEVHQLPSKPLKIEFDPAKGK